MTRTGSSTSSESTSWIFAWGIRWEADKAAAGEHVARDSDADGVEELKKDLPGANLTAAFELSVADFVQYIDAETEPALTDVSLDAPIAAHCIAPQ